METEAKQVSPQELEHLRLLSIFHYVVAGITALFFSFPLIHLTIGILMVTGRMGSRSHDSDGEVMGWIFIFFAGFMVAFGWTLAILMAIAGRSIHHRRRHLFCVIIGGLSCLVMPFGTILGVFTLIILTRPHIKALFAPSAPLP